MPWGRFVATSLAIVLALAMMNPVFVLGLAVANVLGLSAAMWIAAPMTALP